MPRLSYWVLPILGGLVWLATLLALLLYWIVSTHQTRYPSMDPAQTIAYISDVGAAELKPLFITGCVLTTVLLDASFGADRWLRHRGRLAPNTTTGEKVLSGLTIVFAIAGTVGLILLSIFDTARHPRLHDGFLLLFIAGYVLSAVFICWEYHRLGKNYREHRILRLSFRIKLAFVIIEVLLAIAFVACTFTSHFQPGAILEWVIAFIFSAYVFSFFVDLYPAAATKSPQARFTNGRAANGEKHQHRRAGSDGGGLVPGMGTSPKMRLTRGREGFGGVVPGQATRGVPTNGYGYREAGEMEEGSSEAALNGNSAPGVTSFEAARVAHGRRSGSRSRVMASNF
ncbi:Frag1/DRAM/Sfk1 family-domain-containing protein [Dichotomopilus funicola]|uniref:Frag1/DRAM/Sfk1 family-domain-containing protein n=1 Tax=Dichotomopilus funicola TaxID=1934379 RepID=A0AAN6ZRE3_9PEZI|nr:Frag1/DRAM/Sfk1 family-domain-containing protein [Dichotomopilus funicola]